MKDEKQAHGGGPPAEISSSKPADSDSPFTPNHSSGRGGSDFLNGLLSERNQYPKRVAEIDERIRRAFERRVAILALDMSGFSRLTLQLGIIHYLAMIHQMRQAASPAVTGNGGQVIKFEADNLFAIFSDPAGALEGALDIFRAFDAVNGVLPGERHIYGSIGIGYGETLVIDDEDMFGAEMNIACKLGEDLAGRGEILLTEAAYDALPAGNYLCEPATFQISGIQCDCYRFLRTLRQTGPLMSR